MDGPGPGHRLGLARPGDGLLATSASTATPSAPSSGPASSAPPPGSRRRPSPPRASGCATPSPWTTTATATAACGCSATSPPTWTGSCAAGGPTSCARAASPRTATRRPGGRRSATGATDPDAEPARLLGHGGDSARARDLRQLGQVCLAVADGRPIEAVARLDTVQVSTETLGAAEPARLRSIALARAGDHAAAHRADRLAFRLAAQRNDRLRDVFIDGIAARIDHEEMRREAARFEGEALTDPLTGLPNRRRLERYVAALVARGERVVIGVCDLDGFKAVNTRHGHHSGDLVLQRVAGVINRVMRRGDFVARYGGDEFVVVLPGAGMAEAAEVARRIERRGPRRGLGVAGPGHAGRGEHRLRRGLRQRHRPARRLGDAFEAADRAMLRAKTRARGAS